MKKVKIESEDKNREKSADHRPEGAGGPGVGDAPEVHKLKERVAELEKQSLYLRADFDNFRRNVNKERLELAGQGQDQVLKEIFGIIGLLERAIDSARKHDTNDSVVLGLELTRKEIHKVLEKFNVERIPVAGAVFDPKIHEAVSMVDADDLAPGTVFAEQQPGFVREGRVLQAARVVVVRDRGEPGSEPN